MSKFDSYQYGEPDVILTWVPSGYKYETRSISYCWGGNLHRALRDMSDFLNENRTWIIRSEFGKLIGRGATYTGV